MAFGYLINMIGKTFDGMMLLKFSSTTHLRYKLSSSAPHPQKEFENPLINSKCSLVNISIPPKSSWYNNLKMEKFSSDFTRDLSLACIFLIVCTCAFRKFFWEDFNFLFLVAIWRFKSRKEILPQWLAYSACKTLL